MARGRMINTTIALDPEFNSLSLEAQLMFLRTVPHLDRDGLIIGQPAALWATVAPLMPALMPAMQSIIGEWEAAGLVIVIETKIGPVLHCPAFQRNQVGFRYGKEPPSRYQLPECWERDSGGIRKVSGNLPEDGRKVSGNLPEDGRPEGEVEVEVEREEEGRGRAHARAQATQPQPPSPPPALILFCQFHTKDSPSATQATAIAETVTDLDRWRAVLTEWSLRGFNTGNVRGLLDWYRDGIPPANKNGVEHGKHSRRAATDAADDEPKRDPDLARRIREQRERARAAATPSG